MDIFKNILCHYLNALTLMFLLKPVIFFENIYGLGFGTIEKILNQCTREEVEPTTINLVHMTSLVQSYTRKSFLHFPCGINIINHTTLS